MNQEEQTPSSIIDVKSQDDFKQHLDSAGSQLVVVDFYADWCGPCKAIAPTVKAWAEEMKGQVIFLKVNVDDFDEIAQEQGISAMPTFKLYKNGAVVDECIGANKVKILESINKHK